MAMLKVNDLVTMRKAAHFNIGHTTGGIKLTAGMMFKGYVKKVVEVNEYSIRLCNGFWYPVNVIRKANKGELEVHYGRQKG